MLRPESRPASLSGDIPPEPGQQSHRPHAPLDVPCFALHRLAPCSRGPLRGGTGPETADACRRRGADPHGDFLRPPLLIAPSINRAGTGISAVVTAGEDRHLLLVYDEDPEVRDDRRHRRLRHHRERVAREHSRPLRSLGAELVGIGLFAAEIKDLDNSYPLLEYFGSSVVGVPRSDPRRARSSGTAMTA